MSLFYSLFHKFNPFQSSSMLEQSLHRKAAIIKKLALRNAEKQTKFLPCPGRRRPFAALDTGQLRRVYSRLVGQRDDSQASFLPQLPYSCHCNSSFHVVIEAIITIMKGKSMRAQYLRTPTHSVNMP
jgi:hypothetical protein